MDLLVLRDLDPHLVTRKYGRVLDQLRQGDFRSAEVKKLKDFEGGIYRARLDDKDRLLFKMAEHAGRTYLLVLEVVRNHDYAKARFLNGGSYTDADFVAVLEPPREAERLTYVNPASPSFHVLDKALSFDEAQTAVFEAPLPLIVIGSAGSGKTALTLERLKTIPGHGLYLTRSSYLVDNARALYHAHGYANAGQEVDFLSLPELLETIEVPAGRAATASDFRAWYARMRHFRLKEPHRIYEEIHGVITGTPGSGPALTGEEYLGLGIRQSIFLGEERPAVYQVYERWRDHLKESGLYDTNVAAGERRRRARPRYDFLVVDEVQDVTLVELRLALAVLKERRHFLLCGDSNQIVHPNLFSWARVKSLFYGDAAGDTLDHIHVLHANYRNTRSVTAIANRLLLVKQRRFGSIDRESHYLVDSVSGEEGQVDLVPDTPEIRAEIDAKTGRSTRYAVVVLRDEDKSDARAAFSTPLVFSVQEAKGLEYENVILFNLVSAAASEFAECADGVEGRADGELVYARARDKTDKSLDAYKFYVNALYVAMTRAVRALILVERDPAHPLWALLDVQRTRAGVELSADESSREEWQREARRLELQGKTEQADQIRREILETEPVPWPVMDAAAFEAIRARALGPSREKAAQQLLFEYAITYDAPDLFPDLMAAGFRHAKNPESGLAYIEATHYADYRLKRPQPVFARISKYGIDFRNPLNETPLMIAARVGRGDLVRELLAQGADPDLTDTAGRTALRVLLAGFFDGRPGKKADFVEAYALLADRSLKVRLGGRMTKLDPSSMEWFLLNFILVLYRRLIADDIAEQVLPAVQAPLLVEWLATLPDAVLPAYRRKRAYLSSVLAKNEVWGKSPYNRRLFVRVGHGSYAINPRLEIEVKGEWVEVTELLGLRLLLESLPPDSLRTSYETWLREAREDVASFLEKEAEEAAEPRERNPGTT